MMLDYAINSILLQNSLRLNAGIKSVAEAEIADVDTESLKLAILLN